MELSSHPARPSYPSTSITCHLHRSCLVIQGVRRNFEPFGPADVRFPILWVLDRHSNSGYQDGSPPNACWSYVSSSINRRQRETDSSNRAVLCAEVKSEERISFRRLVKPSIGKQESCCLRTFHPFSRYWTDE